MNQPSRHHKLNFANLDFAQQNSLLNKKLRISLLALAVTSVLPLSTAFAQTNPATGAGAMTGTATGMTTGDTTGTTAATVTPTDAQSAAVVMTANKGEIDTWKIAKSRATNKDVKDFAMHMIEEHTKNDKDEKALLKKLKVKPDTTFAKVAALKQEASTKEKELKKAAKADFDKMYIDAQTAMHEEVLATLNDTLIPAAQNSDLKAYLENTKSHVAAHLERAKHLQAMLTK